MSCISADVGLLAKTDRQYKDRASSQLPVMASDRRQIGLEGCCAPKVNEISGSVPIIAGRGGLLK